MEQEEEEEEQEKEEEEGVFYTVLYVMAGFWMHQVIFGHTKD